MDNKFASDWINDYEAANNTTIEHNDRTFGKLQHLVKPKNNCLNIADGINRSNMSTINQNDELEEEKYDPIQNNNFMTDRIDETDE